YLDLFTALYSLFFFSGRRRHTRSTRDWSSDVCSSDLACLRCGCGLQNVAPPGSEILETASTAQTGWHTRRNLAEDGSVPVSSPRSEERRVGEKGRERGEGLSNDEEEGAVDSASDYERV